MNFFFFPFFCWQTRSPFPSQHSGPSMAFCLLGDLQARFLCRSTQASVCSLLCRDDGLCLFLLFLHSFFLFFLPQVREGKPLSFSSHITRKRIFPLRSSDPFHTFLPLQGVRKNFKILWTGTPFFSSPPRPAVSPPRLIFGPLFLPSSLLFFLTMHLHINSGFLPFPSPGKVQCASPFVSPFFGIPSNFFSGRQSSMVPFLFSLFARYVDVNLLSLFPLINECYPPLVHLFPFSPPPVA